MREIKFRAWHTLVKVMYQPTDLEAYSMALLRLPQDGHFELMQYTGRKDKNGKEYYSEDLFQKDNCSFVIKWNDDHAGWWLYWYDNLPSQPFSKLLAESGFNTGNIYENPELVEKHEQR